MPDDGALPSSKAEWLDKFVPISDVLPTAPRWVVPGLLVPGMNLLIGPPKVFKSFLVLKLIAAVLHKTPVADGLGLPRRAGPIAYFSKEQRPGTIRHIYEQRVLKHPYPKNHTDLDFIVPKHPFRWSLDETVEGYDLLDFCRAWEPLITIIDPLIYFHHMDENDPHLVDLFLPLIEWHERNRAAFVVVHHTRKQGKEEATGSSDTANFEAARGTGALFGAANGALKLSRAKGSGPVKIDTIFKEHPAGCIYMEV